MVMQDLKISDVLAILNRPQSLVIDKLNVHVLACLKKVRVERFAVHFQICLNKCIKNIFSLMSNI